MLARLRLESAQFRPLLAQIRFVCVGGGSGWARGSTSGAYPPRGQPLALRADPQGMMSGLMGSMMSGMATGVGMSMANRAVDAVMGPRQTEVVHRHEGAPAVAPGAASCQLQQEQLGQCMKTGDASSCQFYLDALKACQQQQ